MDKERLNAFTEDCVVIKNREAKLIVEALDNNFNILRHGSKWILSQGHMPGNTYESRQELLEAYLKLRPLYISSKQTMKVQITNDND